MSIGRMKERELSLSKVFVKKLSMSVAELWVTRVGLFISGRMEYAILVLKKSLVGECVSFFNKSIL